MSYKIKNTGGVLNIGQLMDFDGETVDIAANKAAIQATWKKADGTNYAAITVAENDGDDYECKLTIAPSLVTVTGTLTPDATGQYYKSGTYEDVATYTHVNGLYHIWLTDGVFWTINSEIGNAATAFRWHTEYDQFGLAYPYGTATGTATVAVTADNESLPLGTHTIRLSSTTDAIIPRNIVIDVVSEAAYRQVFNGVKEPLRRI